MTSCPFSVEIRSRWVPQFYPAAVAASSPPTTPPSIWSQLQIWKRFYYYYCYCRLCNSDLHIQENTHVTSFKTSPSRSLSSSLLFVKYSYCRKFPDLQALPYIRPALASLPTLCLTSPSSLPQLLLHLPLQVYVQFSPDPAHLAPLARGTTVPGFTQTRFCGASTWPAAGLKIKYVGQCCNTGKKTTNSKKKTPKQANGAVSVFCIFRGCRVTNVNFRKVSHDNIRPDFQLGRKEPCSRSLSCTESVLK